VSGKKDVVGLVIDMAALAFAVWAVLVEDMPRARWSGSVNSAGGYRDR